MKRLTSLIAAALFLAALLSTAQAQQTLYWDANGTGAGFFTPPDPNPHFADGTWDTTSLPWTTDVTGVAPPVAWNDAASPANNAVFSILGASGGTPGNQEDGIITVAAGTRTAGTMTVDSGWVALSGSGLISAPNGLTINSGAKLTTSTTPNNAGGYTGNINTGSAQTLVKSGAELQVDTISDFNAANTGKITLQGGQYTQKNFGSAGSFARATQSLEVDGTGTLSYPDASFRLTNATDCNCSIYTPTGANTILGAGGTTTAGAGTLIKTGDGELRFQGTGLPLTTFQKLVVKGGLFRLGFNSSIQDERGFGAVPSTVLPDAITLDGGYIGHSFNATALNANRGITVTANGGGWASGTSTIPGPISGPGRFSILGAGTASGGQLTLTNAANNTTFTGSWNIENGTLVVGGDNFLGAAPASPVADNIMLGGVQPVSATTATTGTLSISATSTLNANRGITLTAGGIGRLNVATGGNTVTYNGVITGSGKFIKMGDGTVTAGGASTYSGGTDIYGKLAVNNTTGSGTGTGAVAVKTTATGLGTNGTLAGTGTISGAVTVESAAHIAPGNSGAGVLSVGSASLLSGSFTDIELGGTTLPQFDRLSAATTAALDGTLTVSLINSYTPANNDTFNIVTAPGGVTGTFAATNLPTLPGVTWNLAYNPNSVSLTASVSGSIAGDYNSDGKVDAQDYVLWRKNPAAHGGDPAGYNAWRANFGTGAGAGSGGGLSGAAVPEPTTLVIAGLAMFFGLAVRRR